MRGNGPADKAPEAAQATRQPRFAPSEFAWLLRQKITIPERVEGYVHRAELVDRAMPTDRRLTVLNAAGGFGKTTLLAECCRSLRQGGVATAWISVDEQDDPGVLDTYLAFTCHDAGLSLLDLSNLEGTDAGPESRIGVLLRQIERFGRPFVIAFDELERLTNPASRSLVGFMLQRGPSNLHLAITCRKIPDALNVAGALLEGRAVVLTAEDLRFSKPEVAKYFGLGLSRSELAVEMAQTAGWPVALCISRNGMHRGLAKSAGEVRDVVKNWVESKLFAGLSADDRDFLLDVGLFDWMDAQLLDEVLQRTDSTHRLNSMRVLSGLLQRGGNATEHWRLHPLVKAHCAEQRSLETPGRFRAIHLRIAKSLERRGDTVSAMRHAVEGGDPALAGQILERAGAVRLWIPQGLLRLRAADSWLSEAVVAERPRLALVRCVVQGLSGRLDEARRLFAQTAMTHPIDSEADQGDDFEHAVDDCLVRGALALYGGGLIGSKGRTLANDFARFLRSDRLDPLTRGQLEYGLCVVYQLKAEFDLALERLGELRWLLAGHAYILAHAELLEGQVAMARGLPEAADRHYRRGQRIARKRFILDPVPLASAEIMRQELALECDRAASAVDPGQVSRALIRNGASFSAVAAAGAVVVDRRLRDGQIDRALTAADAFLNYARGSGLASLIRHFAALRISVLAAATRIDDAMRAWRVADYLPEDTKGCVDLEQQGWREMEAISLARLRCLIEVERFEEGRSLSRQLRALAVERGLRRTLMRALALSIVLERRAGEREAALAHLQEYLGLFVQTPYAWPLVRERAVCAALLSRFVESTADPTRDRVARSLLTSMNRADGVAELILSGRERQVLLLLDGRRDKEIAAELGLTEHGVRHHLRKLFVKLGVAKRTEAVTRAKELGLLEDHS
ncbi:MAG: LuxR C-terminal-related transcriptional regulator [Gammaproteobacteria bacterium]|nr:LuxR C-terminal-related transcriptional regulator [Gammaproteobacteria bacterium]